MQEEAEKHKEEDKKKAEQVETKNKADAMIATAEKALKDGGDKVPADVKSKVEEKIKALKDILETGGKEDLETKTKELSEVLSSVGQAMYASQKPEEKKTEGSEPTEGKDGKKEEKVEEGEVVE
jgi:molecular chaperone DnaK